jgi:Cys-tRNA(Pro)/Cys-tRNA(Cys) deacylase
VRFVECRSLSAKGTPATQVASAAGVAYTLHSYDHDPGAASYGLEAAERLGVSPKRVAKTLVASVTRSSRPELVVGVVPVDGQLDLKALAAAVGSKRAEMAPPSDVERSTGYVLGGVSPLGQRKKLSTVIDESLLEHDTVFVSAGRRGLEIELSPNDLVTVSSATVAPIVTYVGGSRD